MPLDPRYKPEYVDGYEVGLKTEYAGGRARSNFAAFYDEMKDLQVAQFLGTQFTIVNAPEATVYGLEAENSFSLTRCADAWSRCHLACGGGVRRSGVDSESVGP